MKIKEEVLKDLEKIDSCFANASDYLLEDESYTLWNDYIKENSSFNELNSAYATGASKFCIIPDNEDYVIKFPFLYSGYSEYYYSTEDEDEESGELENHYYNELEELSEDYCETEAKVYSRAKKEYSGAEMFLAKTEKIYIGKNIDFYAQEKVTMLDTWLSEQENGSYNIPNEVLFNYCHNNCPELEGYLDEWDNGDLYHINVRWMYEAFKYSVENNVLNALKEFFDFLIDYDINDLHTANIGFIGNKPVLMDYSGWYN